MTDEQAQVFGAGAVELLREARRLGLVWGLRPGEVADTEHVFYDGDEEGITTRVLNLLELPLFPEQRVMVMFVPPAGNFVIGSLTDTKVLFRARRANAQSIPTGSETPVQWDTVDVNTHSMWVSDFPSQVSVPFTGWYQLSGGVGFVTGGGTTGRRGCLWRIGGGTSLDGGAALIPAINASHAVPARVVTAVLEAGSFLELTAFQESGAPLDTVTGTSAPSVDVQFIRPLVPA